MLVVAATRASPQSGPVISVALTAAPVDVAVVVVPALLRAAAPAVLASSRVVAVPVAARSVIAPVTVLVSAVRAVAAHIPGVGRSASRMR